MNPRRFARRLACVLTPLLVACTGAEAHDSGTGGGRTQAGASQADPRPASEQYIVIVDLSGSVTAAEREAMDQFVSHVLRALSFGDRVVVLRAASDGIRTSAPPVPVEMPLPQYGGAPDENDTMALDATRKTVETRAHTLVATRTSGGTDLFASLHQAGELVRQAGGRHSTVVLISDMLQCTRSLCIEGNTPVPTAAWIQAQKRSELVPDLRGSCIVVVGADATTQHGVQVRQFWKQYFHAAGTSLDDARYVHGITDSSLLRCPRR